MRSLIVYPWLVGEFIQWLKPDVSKWAIDDAKAASSGRSDEERIERNVILALSHYDTLRWFEDGRLVGSKDNESHEDCRQPQGLPLQRLVLFWLIWHRGRTGMVNLL